MKKEQYMKILSLLSDSQDIFMKSFKKPCKQIQEAREFIISMVNISVSMN